MAIELDNSFTVPVPPEQAWDVLLDVERIAPCMPGASVTSISDDGNEIEGQVKVKLGPLSLTYKGTAKFTEKDEANRTIAIEATGKETRGAGTASANVQAVLKPGDADGSTLVAIHTALNVTGRPAQFGRSLLPEVSGKLIAQFATNLEAMITADGAGTETADAAPEPAGTAEGASSAAAPVAAPPAAPVVKQPVVKQPVVKQPVVKQEESLNAFKFVVVPVLKRVLPVAAVGAAIAVVIRKLTRNRK
jgi:carbon monoxide dehydrogenase subunit G